MYVGTDESLVFITFLGASIFERNNRMVFNSQQIDEDRRIIENRFRLRDCLPIAKCLLVATLTEICSLICNIFRENKFEN